MYINIPSQYDIVSMAKRFHIGFYAKCKKCDEMYMCCICRLEELKSEMRSFKSNENINKKEGRSYYVVSANKASSVTL